MAGALSHAALRLAKAAAYRGAGVVQLALSTDAERFWLLGFDTLARPSHALAEETTGTSFIGLRLRLAAGELAGPAATHGGRVCRRGAAAGAGPGTWVCPIRRGRPAACAAGGHRGPRGCDPARRRHHRRASRAGHRGGHRLGPGSRRGLRPASRGPGPHHPRAGDRDEQPVRPAGPGQPAHADRRTRRRPLVRAHPLGGRAAPARRPDGARGGGDRGLPLRQHDRQDGLLRQRGPRPAGSPRSGRRAGAAALPRRGLPAASGPDRTAHATGFEVRPSSRLPSTG